MGSGWKSSQSSNQCQRCVNAWMMNDNDINVTFIGDFSCVLLESKLSRLKFFHSVNWSKWLFIYYEAGGSWNWNVGVFFWHPSPTWYLYFHNSRFFVFLQPSSQSLLAQLVFCGRGTSLKSVFLVTPLKRFILKPHPHPSHLFCQSPYLTRF